MVNSLQPSLFQLTPPIQRATLAIGSVSSSVRFQLTPPIQRATGKSATVTRRSCVFQLTPPIQRATRNQLVDCVGKSISTHAPYTEGDCAHWQKHYLLRISTHAPYTEGDADGHIQIAKFNHFNSRPLYRGRHRLPLISALTCIFQLTPPIQRATAKNRQYSPIFRIIINNYNPCNRRLRNIL